MRVRFMLLADDTRIVSRPGVTPSGGATPPPQSFTLVTGVVSGSALTVPDSATVPLCLPAR